MSVSRKSGIVRWEIRTWSLDVSDNATGLVVHEFDANLGDTTTRSYSIISNCPMPSCCALIPCAAIADIRTGTAEDTGDLDELDGLLSGIHLGDKDVWTKMKSRRL